jgi:Fe2+ transport system protein B
MKLPVIVVLNMMDALKDKGMGLDIARLNQLLRCACH